MIKTQKYPSSTPTSSSPKDQIKLFFFKFNFKISKIQPSCFLPPSKPAFLLFPSLNFLLSLFPSHSQLKIFNFRHFTFKNFTSCQTFNIFTLISTPFPTTLPHFKEFDSKVNTLKHSAHTSLPTSLPHFQNSKTPHLSLSIFLPPHRYILKVRAFHTFYKVAPIQTTEL